MSTFSVIPGPEARAGAKLALLFVWEASKGQLFGSCACESVVERYHWLWELELGGLGPAPGGLHVCPAEPHHPLIPAFVSPPSPFLVFLSNSRCQVGPLYMRFALFFTAPLTRHMTLSVHCFQSEHSQGSLGTLGRASAASAGVEKLGPRPHCWECTERGLVSGRGPLVMPCPGQPSPGS